MKTDSNWVDALAARQKPGYTLDAIFYTDPSIFALERERLFPNDWIYVGHISQIPRTGDFLTYNLAEESVIVVRTESGELRAFANVCRHRGSRVCDALSGRVKQFVCPYHGWVYRLDGTLRSARLFPETFDTSEFGLQGMSLKEFHGLIFVSFKAKPESFEPMERSIGHCFDAFGLDKAKVAAQITYPVEANWKLTLENYLECYHCAPAHPEFSQSHSIKLPHGTYPELDDALLQRAELAGTCCDDIFSAFRVDDSNHVSYGYDRYALFEGYETGSKDGKRVAPLMGSIRAFDGGASNGQFGNLCYLLAYCDHTVLYRFTPRTAAYTEMDIFWLVHAEAVEGKDYDRDDLVWLWDVTSIADKTIIERNQAGVRSGFYRPGPYAPMEDWVMQFRDWYLQQLTDSSLSR